MSCFVGLGDKSWDNFKTFSNSGRCFCFFIPKGMTDGPRKLNSTENARSETQVPFRVRAASYKGSESTQVAFKQFAKLQVAGLHC